MFSQKHNIFVTCMRLITLFLWSGTYLTNSIDSSYEEVHMFEKNPNLIINQLSFNSCIVMVCDNNY